MNEVKKLSDDEVVELIGEFEFYNSGTEYIYKKIGNVFYRYSKYLTEWILELDSKNIDMNKNKYNFDFTIDEKQRLIANFKKNS